MRGGSFLLFIVLFIVFAVSTRLFGDWMRSDDFGLVDGVIIIGFLFSPFVVRPFSTKWYKRASVASVLILIFVFLSILS